MTTLTEVEFELSAEQYKLMGFPGLSQGEALTVELETDILLPDAGTDGWFTVQKDRLAPRFIQVAPAMYAFSGEIEVAEIDQEDEQESAVLLVQCGDIPLRVTCGPGADGRLPYGTWETRQLTGFSRVHGIVESSFATAIGRPIGATIWGFRRLVLTPGDAVFGQWHESEHLPATPFLYDRVFVSVRLHRNLM